MKHIAAIVFCCLITAVAAGEQKSFQPYHLYFAEYIEEPRFPDVNIMNAQPFMPGPLGNNMFRNEWIPNFMPFNSIPPQPFIPSIAVNTFGPYEFGQPFNNLPPQPPIPYDSVSPFGNPPLEQYSFQVPYQTPLEQYSFQVPYQTVPIEQFLIPVSPDRGPVPKIGMTFPRPEAIMEEIRLPPSLNKFLPEKVGRTYPLTHFVTETYNTPPTPPNFGYDSGRMEPIMVQSSPTLSILANLWNKK